VVEDVVYIVEVFLNKFADAGVVGDCFEAAVRYFILKGRAFDAIVVHKRVSDMRDF
jgi:hypothetical protein